jgi:Tfp pilus assembly protein PilO
MKLFAGFAKLLGDLWHGRGAFIRLAETSRLRVLLVECAFLALVCGGFYLVRYEASAVRYRQALSRTSAELHAVLLDLEAERRELETARARRDRLASFILDKESRAELFSKITSPSAHSGLEFISMSPQPKRNLEQYARCRAALSVEGGFVDFLRFLRKLESEGIPCSVISIEVEARADTPGAEAEPGTKTAAAPVKETGERISFLVETYAEADPPPLDGKPAR